MKKFNLKFWLGASLVAATLANTQATENSKSKKSRVSKSVNKMIKDQSTNTASITDGSKTERVSH